MIKDFLRKTDLSEDSGFHFKLKMTIIACLILFWTLFSALFVACFYDILSKEISAIILSVFSSVIVILTWVEVEMEIFSNKILIWCKYISLKDYERKCVEITREAEKLENEGKRLLAQAKMMKQNVKNLSKFKKSIGD